MRAFTAVLAAAASASLVAGLETATVPTEQPTIAPGSYSAPQPPNNETTALLIEALSKPYNVTPHVCVAEVFAYETQVVAGFNYRFHVRGAEIAADKTVGWCVAATTKTKGKNCGDAGQQQQQQPVVANQNFTIVVLKQGWLNNIELRTIDKA